MAEPEKALAEIIHDLHWMARRYADMRSSYAPSMLNRHVQKLFELGYSLRSPLYARDGMGRKFDGLSDAEVKAAEDDMPEGLREASAQAEERAQAVRKAVIEECIQAISGPLTIAASPDAVSAIKDFHELLLDELRSLKGETDVAA